MSDDLIAAVIGGGIAISGVLLSQLFALIGRRTERGHERDIRQRERLEKMSDDLSCALLWVTKVGQCKTFEEISSTPPPVESRQVAMAALLYFPELVGPTIDLSNSFVKYYHALLDAFQPGVPASASAQLAMAAKDDPNEQSAGDHLAACRTKLEKKIAEVARNYGHV